MGLSIRTFDETDLLLDIEAVEQLRDRIRGRVLTPTSRDYDEARTIWNAMIDRRPALVARCTNAEDVSRSVRFAREHRLKFSVRGGGHNIAGNAIADQGLLIDLSPMRSVGINPERRRAHVEPGATLGELDRAAQAFGLVTPLGINSTTGVAGLTLGGGFGWLSRRLGLTIDNLVGAEVVTATGERVPVSQRDEPDLFWAIRGGGGNFGVVTSFEFQLHDAGPQVLAGLVVHPLEGAREVLRFYREFIMDAPDELACWFVLRKAPPLPFLAPEWHGREILALAICYLGDLDDGERATRPLRDVGHPIADVVSPHEYTAWQTVLDPLLAPGMRNYWKSHDFHELSDGLIDVLLAHAQQLPDPQTEIAVAQLGGIIGRVPNDTTAYTHRDAQLLMNVHGRWADPAKDELCIAWARALFQAAAPYATGGVYVNFLTQEEEARVRAAYGTNYDRLVALKNRYDPANLFRMNQNIRPTAFAIPGAERERELRL
ncbi:MAG TPA: FAD-binding oxidoreductase [Gemmatimonadaceae bacterium]|nr:FAD-binding oxidoreductase [Gemmatimonadaceae bacterium]